MRHDMAPMARRVANRQQYRPVLALGARQGFITPGVPVDRIGGVLLQIRARFARKSIHEPAGLVACNVRFGTERSGMARRSASSASRRSEARVGPLASCGNAAIGVERKPDSIELGVTGHQPWISPGDRDLSKVS